MTSKTKKPEIKVTLTLTPGTLTPAQKAAGKKFWVRLISECKREVSGER